MNKGKPIHKVTQQENDQGSLKNLSQHLSLCKAVPFWHHKTHGIPYGKHERGKYQVCRGKSMPRCMQQGSIGSAAVARRVYDDHEANGHAPKYIKSNKTLRGITHKQNLYPNVTN